MTRKREANPDEPFIWQVPLAKPQLQRFNLRLNPFSLRDSCAHTVYASAWKGFLHCNGSYTEACKFYINPTADIMICLFGMALCLGPSIVLFRQPRTKHHRPQQSLMYAGHPATYLSIDHLVLEKSLVEYPSSLKK